MGIINKLTTKAEVRRYFSFREASYNTCLDLILRKTQQGRRAKLIQKQVRTIHISEHACERWNQRVGPCITEEKLHTLLNKLLVIPGAITFISSEEGMIDGDIIFTYFISEGCLVITTFYGRISLHPPLNNLNLLKRYNYAENDSYCFHVSQEILDQQSLPLIPQEVIQFDGSRNSYVLEKYVDEKGVSILLLYKIVSGSVFSIIKIDPNRPGQTLLKRRVLYVLHHIGYEDFVLEHLKYHRPDAVKGIIIQELLETMESPLLLSLNNCYIPYKRPLPVLQAVG